MKPNCPFCARDSFSSEVRFHVVAAGHFRRSSDSRWIQRFRCRRCRRSFSTATFHPCYRQKKRQFNDRVRKYLCSGVSGRRLAKLLNLNRKTVARKLGYLGVQAMLRIEARNQTMQQATMVEFDDLETFEHSKCKPLSVTLAVEHKTRRILGFEVSQMPAKGKLSRLALKKYGPRKDERAGARERLFQKIKPLIHDEALIKSDENPHYISPVRRHFPNATHERHKGQRGSIVGQGELKKVRFDPLFSLNHTCAMLRANVNRLFRRTWCTTKLPERLSLHLAMYVDFHNELLI